MGLIRKSVKFGKDSQTQSNSAKFKQRLLKIDAWEFGLIRSAQRNVQTRANQGKISQRFLELTRLPFAATKSFRLWYRRPAVTLDSRRSAKCGKNMKKKERNGKFMKGILQSLLALRHGTRGGIPPVYLPGVACHSVSRRRRRRKPGASAPLF